LVSSGRGGGVDRGPLGYAGCAETTPARESAVKIKGRGRPTVERWAIDRLIPYAKNARTHTDAQVAAIAVDPKIETFLNWSPFAYAFANPVRFVDSTGRGPDDPVGLDKLLSRLDTFAEATLKHGRQVEEFYADAVRDRYGADAIRSWESGRRMFGEGLQHNINDLTRELEAAEHALEPAKRGKVSDAVRRAKAVANELNRVQSSLGREIRLPPSPPPEPARVNRGPKPPPISDRRFMATHDAAIARNQRTTNLPTATARYKGEPPKLLPPGGGGGGAGTGRTGPVRRSAGRSGLAAGLEEGAVAESRLLRYGGKALRGAKVLGKAAVVVGAVVSATTIVWHLAHGDINAAALEGADFFTFGGVSYAKGKIEEGVKKVDEGLKAYQEIRDWNDAGGVPPPFREPKSQVQRMEERFEKRDRFLKSFGF
jgi:hypothetical protein